MKILLIILTLLSLNVFAKERIVLNKANTLVLDTSVGVASMTDLSMELTKLAVKRGAKKYPIYLVLKSPGGSIMSGLRFIEFARHFRDVHTITIYSASMSAYISQAIPGKRYILGTGTMMFHRARISNFGGQLVEGEFESRYKHIRKMIVKMETKNSERIGIPLLEYRKRIKDEWWLYGAEAVKSKTADAVADVLCTPELIMDVKEKTVKSIFGTQTIMQSSCPTL